MTSQGPPLPSTATDPSKFKNLLYFDNFEELSKNAIFFRLVAIIAEPYLSCDTKLLQIFVHGFIIKIAVQMKIIL